MDRGIVACSPAKRDASVCFVNCTGANILLSDGTIRHITQGFSTFTLGAGFIFFLITCLQSVINADIILLINHSTSNDDGETS